jgi:hypothetical protein
MPSLAIPPAPDATLWRHIDFTKFVSLLDTKALFLARADTLADAWEGAASVPIVDARQEQFAANIARMKEEIRKHVYISCWSLAEHESAALWNMYVPSGVGVAVRTTFDRLTGCIQDDGEERAVAAGYVKYIDYAVDVIPDANRNLLPVFFHKSMSFEFEREVRLVINELPQAAEPDDRDQRPIDFTLPSPPGWPIPVDLDTLIEAVHVSPIAPKWFSDLVVSVCGKYGVTAPVVASSLAARPMF